MDGGGGMLQSDKVEIYTGMTSVTRKPFIHRTVNSVPWLKTISVRAGMK